MKLLNKVLKEKFKKIGRQEGVKDPIVIAKFFFQLEGLHGTQQNTMKHNEYSTDSLYPLSEITVTNGDISILNNWKT